MKFFDENTLLPITSHIKDLKPSSLTINFVKDKYRQQLANDGAVIDIELPDKTVQIWQVKHPKKATCYISSKRIFERSTLLKTIPGSQGYIHCFTALDNLVVSGAEAHSVNIWNCSNGNIEHILHLGDKWASKIIAISANSLAMVIDEDYILIWNFFSQNFKELHGRIGKIQCLALLADNKLASADSLNNIFIWDLTTGLCERQLHASSKDTRIVLGFRHLLSLDKGFVTVRNYHRRHNGHFSTINLLEIWDPTYSLPIKSLKIPNADVTAIVLLSDQFLAAGLQNGKVLLINIQNNIIYNCVNPHHGMVISIIKLSIDLFVSAGVDNKIKIWDSNKMCCLKTTAVEEGIRDLLALPNEKLAVITPTGSIKLLPVPQLNRVEVDELKTRKYCCNIF